MCLYPNTLLGRVNASPQTWASVAMHLPENASIWGLPGAAALEIPEDVSTLFPAALKASPAGATMGDFTEATAATRLHPPEPSPRRGRAGLELPYLLGMCLGQRLASLSLFLGGAGAGRGSLLRAKLIPEQT